MDSEISDTGAVIFAAAAETEPDGRDASNSPVSTILRTPTVPLLQISLLYILIFRVMVIRPITVCLSITGSVIFAGRETILQFIGLRINSSRRIGGTATERKIYRDRHYRQLFLAWKPPWTTYSQRYLPEIIDVRSSKSLPLRTRH